MQDAIKARHAPPDRESAFEKVIRNTIAEGPRAPGTGTSRMSAFDRLAADHEAAQPGADAAQPSAPPEPKKPTPERPDDNVPDFD